MRNTPKIFFLRANEMKTKPLTILAFSILIIFEQPFSNSSEEFALNTQTRKIIFTTSTIEEAYQKVFSADSSYFFVVFLSSPGPSITTAYIENGITILNYMGRGTGNGYSYIVKLPRDVHAAIKIMEESGILFGLVEIEAQDKIAWNIFDESEFKKLNTYNDTDSTIWALIEWYERFDVQNAISLLNKNGIGEIIDIDTVIHKIDVRATRENLLRIAEIPEIFMVNGKSIDEIPHVIVPQKQRNQYSFFTVGCFDIMGRRVESVYGKKSNGSYIRVNEYRAIREIIFR